MEYTIIKYSNREAELKELIKKYEDQIKRMRNCENCKPGFYRSDFDENVDHCAKCDYETKSLWEMF